MRYAVVAVALFLAACASPAMYPVPPRDPAINACGGKEMSSLVLHGSLSSGVARVWASDPGGGESLLYWPPGYKARFDPGLIVLDASGAPRAREGDDLLATGPSHGFWVCPAAGIAWVWEESSPTSPPSSPSG